MWESLCVLLPLLHHVVPLKNSNCRLTTAVVKGRYAPDAQTCTFNIDVFKLGKKNYITVKHIYNESANLTGLMFDFDSSDWCDFP